MAKEIGQLSVKIGLDSTGFQNGIGKLNQEMRKVQSEFKLASVEMGKHGKELDSLKLKSDSLTKQTEIQRQKVVALEAAHQKSVETKGKDAKATQDLEIKLNQAKTQLVNMENNLKTLNREIEVQSSGWGKLSKSLEPLGQSLQNVGQKMEAVGKNLSMKVTAPITGLGVVATKAAIDLETAFTGIIKTVDATDEEIAQLKQGFVSMSKEIPIATTELYGIGEAAGQLGIKTENILGFSETMAKLGVTTNMSSETAAASLARLANITGMSQTDFDRLGATIVALGNNLATTESDIVSMGMRIAGAGSQVGMTEAQIMGFAGALSSVGIEAEAGGTAISKLMINIASEVATGGKKLSGFAQVAGMSSADFQKAFKEDAAGAIIAFIGGLGKMKDNGENVFGVIDELGLSEIRLRDALLRASGASDLFRESIELGSSAWQENTALTREAELRFGTTASQLQLFQNVVKLLAADFGEILAPALLSILEKVKPLIDKFGELSEGKKKTIVVIAGVAAAIGPLLIALGMMAQGVGAVMGAAGALSGIFGALSGLLPVLAGAFTVLTGPIGIAIAALAALVVAGVAVYKNWDEIKAFSLQLWEDLKTGWAEGMAALKEGWAEGWASIGELFSGFGEQIALAWTTLWDGLKSFLIEWWPLLLDAIIGPMGLVAGAIYNNWDEIKVKTIEVWDSIKAFCEEWWNIFTTWLLTWNPWNFVKAKWDEFKASTMQVWDKLKTETGAWWSNFTSWLSTWNPWNFVQAKWNEFKTQIMQVWDKLKTETGAWWNIFTSWLLTWNPWNFVQAKWNEFKASTMQVWDKLKTETGAWWSNFTSWLSTWNPWAAVQGLWNTWKENTIQVWRNLKNDAVTWGNNIIQGMADGIRNKLQAAVNAVSDVAESIKDKVKTAFGIASPSTVMKEYGQNISQGLAEGIDDESPSVVAVMESVIEGLQEQIDKAIAILEAFRAEAAKPIMMGPVISGGFGKGGGGGGGGGGGHGGGSVDGIGSWSGTGRYDEGSGSGKGTGQFVGGDSNNSGWEVVDKGDSYYVPGIGDVDKKAEGGILTGPRFVFAGEAGSEAILPLAKLQPMMTEALLNSIRSLNRRMIGELGPELVASPRRNRIYNDQPILGGNKGITQHITIHSPTPLTPAETARRIKNASRQLALEW